MLRLRQIVADVVAAIACVVVVGFAGAAVADAPARAMPIFDAHVHYNKAAWRVFDPPYVLQLMQRAGVVGGLVGSWPDDGTVKMHSAFPTRFIAELCPYRDLTDGRNWTRQPGVLRFFEERIATRRYQGLGELHIYNQNAVDWSVIAQVVGLARKNDLFLHIHARADVIERLFQISPDVRILWAHAGFYDGAAQISAMLDRFPKLTAELSLRAPNIFPELERNMRPDWRALFLRHPDRFVIGTDTYINLAWTEYDEIIDAHRRWLSRLPRSVAEKIAWRNARAFFSLPGELFERN